MTGSDAAGAAPLPFSPFPPVPQRPSASFPSSLEPRRSLVSRGWSPEDLELWAFGMGEDMTKLGQVPSPGVQGAGGKKDG